MVNADHFFLGKYRHFVSKSHGGQSLGIRGIKTLSVWELGGATSRLQSSRVSGGLGRGHPSVSNTYLLVLPIFKAKHFSFLQASDFSSI